MAKREPKIKTIQKKEKIITKADKEEIRLNKKTFPKKTAKKTETNNTPENKNEVLDLTTDSIDKKSYKAKVGVQKPPFKIRFKNFFRSFGRKTKIYFVGVGKEFNRISWITRKKFLQDFITVLVLIAIIVLMFLAIDAILLVTGII